jgi:hypothetical protein
MQAEHDKVKQFSKLVRQITEHVVAQMKLPEKINLRKPSEHNEDSRVLAIQLTSIESIRLVRRASSSVCCWKGLTSSD